MKNNLKILFLSIILCSSLGCRTIGTFIDNRGDTWTASINGHGKATMKDGDMEMTVEREKIIKLPDWPDIDIDQ